MRLKKIIISILLISTLSSTYLTVLADEQPTYIATVASERAEIKLLEDEGEYDDTEYIEIVERKTKRKFTNYHKVLKYNKKVREKYTSYEATLNYYSDIDGNSQTAMYHVTDAQIKLIKKQAKIITKGITSDYEKSKALYKWITSNMWFSTNNGYSILEYEDKYAGSAGMAEIAVVFYRAAGIPANIIVGLATGNVADYGGISAWVEIYADNRWITIDPSFDCNNRYYEGIYSEKRPGGMDYFDQSIEVFSEDHEYQHYDMIFFSSKFFDPFKDENVVVPEGFTHIKSKTIKDAQGTLKQIKLPNTLVELDTYQFQYCSKLQKVTLPNAITTIPEGAFEHCYKLKSITIPNSVTSIGANAFAGCDSLTKVVIPKSVKKIDKTAFAEVIDSYFKTDGSIHHDIHKPKNLKIYGEKGSYAEKYAKKYKITFVAMD